MAVAAALVTPSHAAAKKPAKKTSKKPAKAESTSGKKDLLDVKVASYVSAHLKFFSILDRYASTLAGATDQAAAKEAVISIDGITKEVIVAGEELVKLGRPAPEMEAKIARHTGLQETSRKVAANTQAAITALNSNMEVRPVLAPAVQNFLAALNRLQQTADDPQAPVASVKSDDEEMKKPAAKEDEKKAETAPSRSNSLPENQPPPVQDPTATPEVMPADPTASEPPPALEDLPPLPEPEPPQQ